MIDSTRKTYLTPYDDAQTPLVDLLLNAKKKIRMADYSYNLANLTAALIHAHQMGVDVSLVLDKSQAGGKTEVPEIAQLKAAGVPMVIGSSSKGKIMHCKFVVVDDTTTASGSYNYTGTAELEDNFEDIEVNPTRAAAFTAYWQRVYDFIVNKGKSL